MKNGFKVLDSDLHTMEPDGLWERYLDEPFKKFAPTFARREDNAPNQPVIKIGALEIAEFSKKPRTALVGKSLHERAFARSSDALTHGGQLSNMRGVAGAAVRPESYAKAEIQAGRVGREQSSVRKEFDGDASRA